MDRINTVVRQILVNINPPSYFFGHDYSLYLNRLLNIEARVISCMDISRELSNGSNYSFATSFIAQSLRDYCVAQFGWSPVDAKGVMELVSVMSGKKVLSVGSGVARTEYVLSQHGIDIVCSDIDPYIEYNGSGKPIYERPNKTAFYNNNISSKHALPFMKVDKMKSCIATMVTNPDVLFCAWSPYIYEDFSEIPCSGCCEREADTYHADQRRSLLKQWSAKSKLEKATCGKQKEFVDKHCPKRYCDSCNPNYSNAKDVAYNALKYFRGDTLVLVGEGEGGCTGSPRLFHELKQNWILEKYVDQPNWDGIHSGIYIYKRKV